MRFRLSSRRLRRFKLTEGSRTSYWRREAAAASVYQEPRSQWVRQAASEGRGVGRVEVAEAAEPPREISRCRCSKPMRASPSSGHSRGGTAAVPVAAPAGLSRLPLPVGREPLTAAVEVV